MKKLAAALMLLVSGSAFAEPSLFEKMKVCSFYASKVTEYSVYAHAMKPEDLHNYLILVQGDIDLVSSPSGKQTIAFLGEIAWKNRSVAPTQVGMAIYDECFARTGTKT